MKNVGTVLLLILSTNKNLDYRCGLVFIWVTVAVLYVGRVVVLQQPQSTFEG